MVNLLSKFSSLFVLHLGLGINIRMHGLVRSPKLSAFATKMVAGFEGIFLPLTLVKPFLFALPILELLTGLLILTGGRWSRYGFMLYSLLLAALLFGTTLK